MIKFIRNLFKGKKQQCNIPDISKRFCINYVVDGNLAIELQYYCDATTEAEARYDFWDTHNELYHDIISVNVC